MKLHVIRRRTHVDPILVSALSELLEQAKRGDLLNFAIVGETTDGHTFSECKGPVSAALIGEMTLYQHELAMLVNQFRVGE